MKHRQMNQAVPHPGPAQTWGPSIWKMAADLASWGEGMGKQASGIANRVLHPWPADPVL